MGTYPVIALKTNMANLKGTKFDLEESRTGTALKNIAKDRVIDIEQLSGLQRQEYDKLPAPPNEFEIGGRAATKLGLSHLSAMEWVSYGNKAISNILIHAEWITQMPVPNPPKTSIPKTDSSLKKLMEDMEDDDI
jgi:hypothetical protein